MYILCILFTWLIKWTNTNYIFIFIFKWVKLSFCHVSCCPREICSESNHLTTFLLINTLLVSLPPISLWKFIFCKALWTRALSLATGLVARIQLSHSRGLTSVSGWEPEPCFKPLQARLPKTTYSKYWDMVMFGGWLFFGGWGGRWQSLINPLGL